MTTLQAPVEKFPALSDQRSCRHAFIKRISGIDVSHDKAAALRALEQVHRHARRTEQMGHWPLITGAQVHGNKVAVLDEPLKEDQHLAGYDGLITAQRRICLGVYVADCCAVYLLDAGTPAVGLLHSGRKGTDLNIVGLAIEQMIARFGTDVTHLIVQLSPCIRPPHYDTDFAARIVEQCRARGIRRLYDSGVCTACDLDNYYSYRAEKGKTGRMLALLGLV